jgi:hypothetical protein
MGLMPDIKGITAKLEDRFAQMMTELQLIRETLDAILGELRTQRGAPQ